MTSRAAQLESSPRLRRVQNDTNADTSTNSRGTGTHERVESSARGGSSPAEGSSSSASHSNSGGTAFARSSDSVFREASNGGTAQGSQGGAFSRRLLLGRLRASSAPGTSGAFSFPHVPQRTRSRSRSGTFSESTNLKKKGGAAASTADADREASLQAQIDKEDAMIYLDGPQVYTCAQCRTHLTSHDDIISKSFHGRHGRAYLFDQCVNVTAGSAEDRLLITGMHSVCDIFCNRCRSMVGWTYAKAYEPSQKYKEGKFIIEKINLHLEETIYGIDHPAGERGDKWRVRSMSWGSGEVHNRRSWDQGDEGKNSDIVYEYANSTRERSVSFDRSVSFGSNAIPPPSSPNTRAKHRVSPGSPYEAMPRNRPERSPGSLRGAEL